MTVHKLRGETSKNQSVAMSVANIIQIPEQADLYFLFAFTGREGSRTTNMPRGAL
jgi:hypothetical protein